jgi:hypothetical protein
VVQNLSNTLFKNANNLLNFQILNQDRIEFVKYLIEFKNRLFQSHLISYTFRSKSVKGKYQFECESFLIDPSLYRFEFIEKELAKFSLNNTSRIVYVQVSNEIIKALIEILWKMVAKEKDYIEKAFQNETISKKWLEKVKSALNLGQLKFLFFFFVKNVRWDMSLESKCLICSDETLNSQIAPPNDEDLLLKVKTKCSQCQNVYHLNCLFKSEVKWYLKQKSKSYELCHSCKLENEFEIELIKIEKKMESDAIREQQQSKFQNLLSIEKGGKPLRLNKARQIILETRLDSGSSSLPSSQRKSKRRKNEGNDYVELSDEENQENDEYVPRATTSRKKSEFDDFIVTSTEEEMTETENEDGERILRARISKKSKKSHQKRPPKKSKFAGKRKNAIQSSESESDSKSGRQRKKTNLIDKSATVAEFSLRPRRTKVNYKETIEKDDDDED